jgi:electron transport complex protein RnfE
VASTFTRGIIRENPIFVTLLGLCPSLAVTTHVDSAVSLAAAVVIVLTFTSLTVSLARDLIPAKARTAVLLGVISVYVTGVDLLMTRYAPVMRERLGIFVPLIVVNCLILGRASAVYSRATPGRATADALGFGVGFLLALTAIAAVRESLGAGTITLFPVGSFSGVVEIPALVDSPMRVFGLAAGAFLVVGYLHAAFTLTLRRRSRGSHGRSAASTAASEADV